MCFMGVSGEAGPAPRPGCSAPRGRGSPVSSPAWGEPPSGDAGPLCGPVGVRVPCVTLGVGCPLGHPWRVEPLSLPSEETLQPPRGIGGGESLRDLGMGDPCIPPRMKEPLRDFCDGEPRYYPRSSGARVSPPEWRNPWVTSGMGRSPCEPPLELGEGRLCHPPGWGPLYHPRSGGTLCHLSGVGTHCMTPGWGSPGMGLNPSYHHGTDLCCPSR